MNLETAENIQCEFESLALDGHFPIFFASHGNIYKDWQFAVEFIYRLLICELAILEPINFKTEKEIFDFCNKLANQNPFDEKNELWYWGEIVLTKKGMDLVNTYIPQAFEEWDGTKLKVNVSFIEILKEIFMNYRVVWDENNPLFPIFRIDATKSPKVVPVNPNKGNIK